MKQESKHVIIVAGGSGTRMGTSTPKQFLEINGKAILIYTLESFVKAIPEVNIVLVLPQDQISKWKDITERAKFNLPHTIVRGGYTRGESVLNGLKTLPEEGFVAIHDGVRPFISAEVINRSFEEAKEKGNAIVATKLKDSIRQLTDKGSKAIDRECLRIVQTPQTFRLKSIKEAYIKVQNLNYTDDATVAELAGQEINLIEGNYDNIKITTPEDLILGEGILKRLKL